MTNDYTDLTYELDERGLLEITLDRPSRFNALSPNLGAEIIRLLESVDETDVSCVTFEGAGDRAFSAGADIDSSFSDLKPYQFESGEMFNVVSEFPRPTLAKIDGLCLGGGHELALACDLRVATTDSKFGFPEIGLGIIPGGGGTQRTVRLVGEARAKELVLRGNQISANRAENWGLINRAVSPNEFEDTIEEYVDDLVNGPPIALQKANEVIDEGQDLPLDTGLELEENAFSLLLTTEDMQEGMAAFQDDREPDFEGQ
jgi:enoyl-CoA hydratase/3-hydroxyacyl-CoA dehydrogenase